MAANKFATMLHRHTNRVTMILVYALLEWALIILLLLNSLFSYLITKFACYFGLKPPCLWCSRVDSIFVPGKGKNIHRDLLCEVHASEISKLGYCTHHGKLAESHGMCEDCSSSRPNFCDVSNNFNFFPLMKKIEVIQSSENAIDNNDKENLICSCCGVTVNNNICSPYIVIKPCWDVLDFIKKSSLVETAGDDHPITEGHNLDQFRSDSATDRSEAQQVSNFDKEIEMLFDVNGGFGVTELGQEENCSVSVSKPSLEDGAGEDDSEKADDNSSMAVEDPSLDQKMVQIPSREDESIEIAPWHLDFVLDFGGHKLVPVELVDSTTDEDQSKTKDKEEDQNSDDHKEAKNGSESSVMSNGESMEHKFAVLKSMEIEETDNSLVFHAKGCNDVIEVYERCANAQVIETTPRMDTEIQEMTTAEGEKRDSDEPPVFEETSQVCEDETESEVSIGTEIPDLDKTDEIQKQGSLSSYAFNEESSFTSSGNLQADSDDGSKKPQEETLEFRIFSVPVSRHANNHPSSLCSEPNEIEEERVPNKHLSMQILHHLHKKLPLLENKDTTGTEQSVEGSITSEFEVVDGDITIERLKEALRAERKALHALYAELEDERSASAIAANQTMAMINRLQEEKAAMQMEALQFQRMMEEQTDYDQEALQLLNELMVKKERGKQELEKELEVYKKKVLDYEAREKMRMLRSSNGSARTRSSSAYCSNAEDSDHLSMDLNQEPKEDDGNHGTPVDAILNLEESLADYDEERLSILEQLKVLEEKLIALSDDGEEEIETLHTANGNHLDRVSEVNGYANGFHKEMNGMPNGKRLLPLFDAVSDGEGNGKQTGNENGHCNGMHKSDLTTSVLENRKLSLEEEVDQIYERLQSFEADRQFLMHCISSLKKGDKGIYLLQEILQHLRDLRNVELRMKNLNEICSTVM